MYRSLHIFQRSFSSLPGRSQAWASSSSGYRAAASKTTPAVSKPKSATPAPSSSPTYSPSRTYYPSAAKTASSAPAANSGSNSASSASPSYVRRTSTQNKPTSSSPSSSPVAPTAYKSSSSTPSSSSPSSSSPSSSSPTASSSSSSLPNLFPPSPDEPHPFAPEMMLPNLDTNDSTFSLDDSVQTQQSPLPTPSHETIDWSRSFNGLSTIPFDRHARDILLEPISPDDIEVKPDGIVYLPEIKYRRILNRAFGPGGWGLAPRGETTITPKLVTREYGLVVHGRLVSIARGEQQYFDIEGVPTATEGCKSNALMRCCKDLGIASELWDPVFIRAFAKKYTSEVWVEHVTTKKRRKIVIKNGTSVAYPYKLSGGAS